MDKKERARERREKRRQQISLLRTIPYSDHQRWWTSDTIAVVTGANRGIGFEIAYQLALHGMTVVLTSREIAVGEEATKVLQEGGLNVAFHHLDIVDPSSIQSFTEWIKENYGGLDILVNNAGVNFNMGSDNSVEFADKVIQTNYFGTKNMIKAMIPLMKPSDSGARIVNVSSRLGRLNGKRNRIENLELRKQLEDEASLSEELIDQTVQTFLEQVKEGRPYSADLQHQQVFLKDTDERACAYIAGPAPNRWGFTFQGNNLLETVKNVATFDEHLNFDEQSGGSENVRKDLQERLRAHPLFFAITMGLLAEIINSRLFTTVRDSLGLTYDVSFELNLFDRLNLGWYVISVTSTPGKVHKAVDACKNVLRGLHSNRIAPRELDRARRTLLMRHEAEIKSNAYWLGLMAHLQATSVPRKDISCIKDLTSLYESATIEDVYTAYEQLKIDESSLYSCIGIAGSQAGEDVTASLVEEEVVEGLQSVIPVGRGSSTMTRPTT